MLKNKSYLLFFIAAIIVLIYSFMYQEAENLVLNIKDTYYVIKNKDFYRFYAAFIIVIGAIYILFDKTKIVLKKPLEIIHVFGTMMLFIMLIYLNFRNEQQLLSRNFKDLINQTDFNFYIIILLLMFLLLQFLFIINIFAIVIKHIRVFVAKKQKL